jgi:hypothetical protein
VSTNPIIEDCTELGFAPFSVSYADLPAQLQVSSTSPENNLLLGVAAPQRGLSVLCCLRDQEANLQNARNWNIVVDFKWLRAQRSPNWYEIEESARKQGPLEQLLDVSFAPSPSSDA